MKKSILIMYLCCCTASAKESMSFFVKHELNADDRITGIGASFFTAENYMSNIRGEGISSINYAKVLDENDNMQNYISWDVGLRVGYYSGVFMYIEGGLDVLEILADDLQEDDNDYGYYPENGNDLDGYAAIGAGFNTGKIKLEGFIKARKIDSHYWESKHQIYYGAQFSLSF